MNTIKNLALATFIFGFSATSHAKPRVQRARQSKAKFATSSATPHSKMPKTKDYDFLADEVDGQRLAPTGDSIYGIDSVEHATLIRYRQHFIREIVASAYAL